MDASHPGRLRIWEGGTPGRIREPLVQDIGHTLAGPHKLAPFADLLYAREVLNPSAGTPGKGEGAEPYTLQWFLNAEQQRYRRPGRWIPRLMEFSKHSGETMLGLGDGLGTDWVQYARYGARVVVCSPWWDQLSLVRRNFELRGLTGRFLHAQPSALPLENATVDVVCLSDLAQELADPKPVIEEIYRVLKPGGKVLGVLPARYDIDSWIGWSMPWQRWFGIKAEGRQRSKARFTRRKLRQMFARFVNGRVQKRQLARAEVPHLWRWVPLSFLERFMGHVLVYKAFKPLSAAMAVQEAA
jgi:SAM-dependent methyltransferase